MEDEAGGITTENYCENQMASGGAVLALHERNGEGMESSAHDYFLRRYNEGPSRNCSADYENTNAFDDIEARIPLEKDQTREQLDERLNNTDSILRLNIGGTSYRIRTQSIFRHGPRSLLGKFVRVDHELRKQWADWYFEESDEYFFERVPRYIFLMKNPSAGS
ncbi:unnamed protein product [Gongylonema pulchrum]|uniref:BTB_2 domain-containing protein n=1 Tax=Gongylonema pulchrum TaxID=637853 RepID=A0A183CZ99_9BILA|nr:unnamed protein product [Gongylonema pulchrum]